MINRRLSQTIILVVDGQTNNNLELELKNLEYIKNLRIYRLPKNVDWEMRLIMA